MHQRRAVQQLNCYRCSIGQQRVVVAASASHSQAKLRPDARTAGEHRMAHRIGQFGRAARFLAQG